MQIIGHRGAPRLAQENTLSSFAAAIDAGVEMVELDVRETLDGILIVHHDAMLKGKLISKQTYWDLQALAADSELLPTFKEVLELIQGNIKVNIEIKSKHCTKKVIQLAKQHLNLEDFCITSFWDEVILETHYIDPAIRTGLLVPGVRALWQGKTGLGRARLLTRLAMSKADFVAIHRYQARNKLLDKLKDANVPVVVWTVNKSRTLRKLAADERVEAVITDIPDLATKMIAMPKRMQSFFRFSKKTTKP